MTAVRMLTLALQHLPESLLTYNLHILVCRLSKQETAKGCVATCGELWVERNTQFVESNVKYRTTSCPEKLYVHDLMVDEALAAMRHDDSLNASVRTAVKSFDELVPKYRVNIRSGPSYDTGRHHRHAADRQGQKLKHDAFETAMQHVSQYLHRMGQCQWLETASQAEPQPVQLCSYTLAHKCGDDLMWSRAHKRSKRCPSMPSCALSDREPVHS
ncbi:TPA: hypothetical protein ACH3X1_010220 [Trebouxia sp. C0004]